MDLNSNQNKIMSHIFYDDDIFFYFIRLNVFFLKTLHFFQYSYAHQIHLL